MKSLFLILAALALTASVAGQEKAGPDKAGQAHQMPAPPPLSDETMQWMVGEWEGWTKSPMGESKEWMKCSLILAEQFLGIEYKSTLPDGKAYVANGLMTYRQDGKVIGYWFDSFRSVSEGLGVNEGNKTIVEWTSAMGNHTRITERVGSDEMKITIRVAGPDGKMTEGYGEMKRVK